MQRIYAVQTLIHLSKIENEYGRTPSSTTKALRESAAIIERQMDRGN
jgi:hypothetical protein